MSVQAGVGVCDISPRKPMFLAGYPHVGRISTGVHDPLLATALCLRNGRAGILLVAVDILFIDPTTARYLRQTIAERVGLPVEAVFISCTHTHSGPVTLYMLAWRDDPVVPSPDPAYMELLRKGVMEAAVESTARLFDVQLAWTTADALGIGGNRLSKSGITDSEAGVLTVRDKNSGEWINVMVVYGMHPTVLHEDSTLVSADFPAFTRRRLRNVFGENLVVLYHNGPCGNQSPRHYVGEQTFTEAERLGVLLGERIELSVRNLTDEAFRDDMILASLLELVDLPARTMPSIEEAEARLRRSVQTYESLKNNNAEPGMVRTAACAVFGAEETVTLARAQADGSLARVVERYRHTEVQGLRIGDAILIGWPGEVFVEYALELKEAAAMKTFVVSLVNGDMQGYIVTEEAAAAGGYEAMNSLFEAAAGERLVSVGLNLCRRLAAVEE